MQIYGPFRVSTTQSAGGASPTNRLGNTPAPQPKPTAAPNDQLDLSAANRLNASNPTSQVSQADSGEIRVDRVAQLRREIAQGTYETPDKLDAALDRLLDQIG